PLERPLRAGVIPLPWGGCMKFIKSKKGLVLLATLVVAAAAAIGGYAYFTSSGSGTGSATVGSTTNTITVSASDPGALYPLASAPASPNAKLTVTNNGSGQFYVNQVSLDTSQGTNGISTGDPNCDPTWFHFDGGPFSIG